MGWGGWSSLRGCRSTTEQRERERGGGVVVCLHGAALHKPDHCCRQYLSVAFVTKSRVYDTVPRWCSVAILLTRCGSHTNARFSFLRIQFMSRTVSNNQTIHQRQRNSKHPHSCDLASNSGLCSLSLMLDQAYVSLYVNRAPHIRMSFHRLLAINVENSKTQNPCSRYTAHLTHHSYQ